MKDILIAYKCAHCEKTHYQDMQQVPDDIANDPQELLDALEAQPLTDGQHEPIEMRQILWMHIREHREALNAKLIYAAGARFGPIETLYDPRRPLS